MIFSLILRSVSSCAIPSLSSVEPVDCFWRLFSPLFSFFSRCVSFSSLPSSSPSSILRLRVGTVEDAPTYTDCEAVSILADNVKES